MGYFAGSFMPALRSSSPLFPKAGIGLAGFDVDGDEETVERAEEDTRRIVLVARPVGDAARGRPVWLCLKVQMTLPVSGSSATRDCVRCRDIHHAVDDERRGLALASAATGLAAVGVGAGRVSKVQAWASFDALVVLIWREGGVAGAAGIAAVGLPIGLREEGRDDQCRDESEYACAIEAT